MSSLLTEPCGLWAELGTRVSKSDSAGSKIYRRDGAYVTDPVLADGAATYTPGVSERRNGVSKQYQSDYLGSTRLLTGSHSLPTDTRTYDAFGNPVSSTGSTPTPFTFAGAWGYQSDSDTGLQLLGHRYYDPSLGRFLLRDPVQSGTNWFTYAENGPTGLVDPSGLDPSVKRAQIPEVGEYWDGYYNTIDRSDPKDWLDNAANFFGGWGDELTLGLSAWFRQRIGCDDIVDRNSGAYQTGGYVGLAHTTALGGALGWRSASKKAGQEFSHWIPDRALKLSGSNFIRNTFGRSLFNGNYVTPKLHALIDPFRYTKGLRKAQKYSFPVQQGLRVPRVYIGAGGGYLYGSR